MPVVGGVRPAPEGDEPPAKRTEALGSTLSPQQAQEIEHKRIEVGAEQREVARLASHKRKKKKRKKKNKQDERRAAEVMLVILLIMAERRCWGD